MVGHRDGPRAVVVVGPAAAGKSTFVEVLKRVLGFETAQDDLNALSEALDVERALVGRNASEEAEALVQACRTLGFGGQYAAEQLSHLRRHGTRRPAIRPVADGFSIVRPDLWDAVLVWIGRAVAGAGSCVVQFSRGSDPAYQRETGVGPRDIYRRAIAILVGEMGTGLSDSCAVLHVTADWETRRARNQRRRERGEHAVSAVTMQTVYRRDLFRLDHALSANSGTLSLGACQLRVWRVDNSRELLDQERTAFIELHVKRAIKFWSGER